MWTPTGNRQSDNISKMEDGANNRTKTRRRVINQVRVFAGTVKWSYLEMEDDLKCRFWNFFSGNKSKCNNKNCPTCYPKPVETTESSHFRDGRISTLLQKIRTWPRLGSRRIRNHTAQGAQQPQPGQSPLPGRMKAASFPAKHRDLSRARFLPRFKKFESIREESDYSGSTRAENQLPKASESLYTLPVVEVDIGGNDTESTSVEDLSKYSYSFGSDMSFGNRDDSMAKDQSMSRDIPSTMIQNIDPPRNTGQDTHPTSASSAEVSESAGPTFQSRGYAVPFQGSSLGPTTPSPAGSSEVADSLRTTYDHGWHTQTTDQIESPVPEPCALHVEKIPQPRYNGVRWKAKKWTSEIRPTGAKRTVWLGTYNTEEEAASAYDAGIYYYNKPRNYNFPDSETYLPRLNPSMDDRAQLNFIKTQARLIAQKRAKIMAEHTAVPRRNSHPSEFNPRTPDTPSSEAGPADSRPGMGEPSRSSSIFTSLKRVLSGDSGFSKTSRRKY
uniref:AP2/ERF domain-containing protein n=1 Tax=Physcomitrium patens TaxID=3218 RepID=A9TNY5_PHYPA|nr:uncharacterized protein LOC112278487 [Physcomitrium patens]XP_024367816.1 uncharacterized protein LOC112278487 [Physcomitrium patens]XP_024367817.1 uncharacterized protein LOC112278487 [Physcomitrium patens]XP_024367818.1 uncharacterized protein LOC112278487 [Physcomitrium patens]XP_024367819.1 uncharacterized protein LOC112278487 [Physcomitrium patens]XP_024367820.1 uncharacterized protein LOC112278487 [Physcomitrium patens]XP_024367821.1 uncharacterized protein LOC112278487 [Physcomitriu|eukprot:XP_024367815.1 uncharacterized protein LOC112278487 [Physcomitrella patens]